MSVTDTVLTPALVIAQQEALTKSKHGPPAVEVVAQKDAKPPFDPASSRKTPEIGTITLQDIDEAFADEEKK